VHAARNRKAERTIKAIVRVARNHIHLHLQIANIVESPFVYLLHLVPSCENSSFFSSGKNLFFTRCSKGDEGSQRPSSKNKTASIYWFTVSLFMQIPGISGYIISPSIKISSFQKE
jgi:hypothetical protein